MFPAHGAVWRTLRLTVPEEHEMFRENFVEAGLTTSVSNSDSDPNYRSIPTAQFQVKNVPSDVTAGA